MARYVIGDVQGCYVALRALTKAINFDPDDDELWLAGDLVNRGPDSRAVLQWARDHQTSVRAVLGNHDLYLIGRATGALKPRRRDTLDALLEAPDSEELIAWLRRQPLLHHEGTWVMVHAALHPEWSLSDAVQEARALEALIQGEGVVHLLEEAHASSPRRWSRRDSAHMQRLSALATFTRLRCLDLHGELTFDYTGPLDTCPSDRIPWWRAPHVRGDEMTVIIGHWAALGYHRAPGLLATDTGCAWGRHLSAVNLSDGTLTQVSADGSVSRPQRP